MNRSVSSNCEPCGKQKKYVQKTHMSNKHKEQKSTNCSFWIKQNCKKSVSNHKNDLKNFETSDFAIVFDLTADQGKEKIQGPFVSGNLL